MLRLGFFIYFALSRASEGVTGHVAPPNYVEFYVRSVSDSFQAIEKVLSGPESKNHPNSRKTELLFWSGFFYLGYHCSIHISGAKNQETGSSWS